MARTYTLKRRAEAQAETRRRIVEAAVELHSTLGPAATSFSMIAEKAGVQRHTFYAHFPDERSVLMACSAHSLAQDPLPEAAPWRPIADPAERLRVGLRAVYDWYERNESLVACVLRDAETHELVREIMALRYGPGIGAWHEALGAGLKAKQRPLLALALSFHSWRTLTREAGLKQAEAVKAMMHAVIGTGQ
ncbi:MAG TPA: TetR/AcrR family transcriptional regulator [Vitreimonas sp.]|uniref:TetR/AcrR family transcriptional regulator n=1 Tax=Vitreimonas sp. TaxID=3069702 RepID=UPI002D6A6C95|nr:TetR/AcrR family transcriptional regulator [Vitreimonas sp.]HYD87608.1 TetR/AcrR family transcriptional regulator [Vitreimonas sp.]